MSLNQTDIFDFEEVFQKSPLGILVSDKIERIIWCNEKFLVDMNLSKEFVIGQLYPALPFEAVDRKKQILQVFNNKMRGNQFHYWQQSLEKPAGAKVHYFALDRQGQRNKFDKKTSRNVANKSNWLEFLDYEVSRSRRYDNPLSILKLHILLLDGSDEVESQIHQIVRHCFVDELRWADMYAHTDHGSYIIILPETPNDVLIRLQEKLHLALTKKLEKLEVSFQFHIVFGRAHWKKHDDSERLIQRARNEMIEKLEALLE